MTSLIPELPTFAAVLALAKLGLLAAMMAWPLGTLLGRGAPMPSPAHGASTGARR